jgi:hypothetical protein
LHRASEYISIENSRMDQVSAEIINIALISELI